MEVKKIKFLILSIDEYIEPSAYKCTVCPAECATCLDTDHCLSCVPGKIRSIYDTDKSKCVDDCKTLSSYKNDAGLLCVTDCYDSNSINSLVK